MEDFRIENLEAKMDSPNWKCFDENPNRKEIIEKVKTFMKDSNLSVYEIVSALAITNSEEFVKVVIMQVLGIEDLFQDSDNERVRNIPVEVLEELMNKVYEQYISGDYSLISTIIRENIDDGIYAISEQVEKQE